MDCKKVAEKYGDYLMGGLSPGEREAINEHIQDCVECFLMDESNREFLQEGAFKRFIRINMEARK